MGVVKSLNMRYVLICEFDGKEVIIPNETMLTSNIANLTHSQNLMRTRIDLILPLDLNIEIFRSDVVKLMNSNPYASKVEECVFHIDHVSERGIHIFLFFWIDNPYDVFIAKTSIMLEILTYIRDKGINLPAPVIQNFVHQSKISNTTSTKKIKE